MKKLNEGWNDVAGTTLSIYVEDGRVKRGTEGIENYHTVYPYQFEKKENAYINISGIKVKDFLRLYKEQKIRWM